MKNVFEKGNKIRQGDKNPNAGRKKGSVNRFKEKFETKCLEIISKPEFLKSLEDISNGVLIVPVYDGGGNLLYKKPAETRDQLRAKEILLDRGIGKSAQAVSLTDGDGSPLKIVMTNFVEQKS